LVFSTVGFPRLKSLPPRPGHNPCGDSTPLSAEICKDCVLMDPHAIGNGTTPGLPTPLRLCQSPPLGPSSYFSCLRQFLPWWPPLPLRPPGERCVSPSTVSGRRFWAFFPFFLPLGRMGLLLLAKTPLPLRSPSFCLRGALGKPPQKRYAFPLD